MDNSITIDDKPSGPDRSDTSTFLQHLQIGCGVIAGALFMLTLFLSQPKPKTPDAAVMPSQINVMGVEWQVDRVPYPGNFLDAAGYTHCDVHVIDIRNNLGDAREVLAHELLHAAVCGNAVDDFTPNNLWYNSKTEEGHEGFDHIAYVWTELLIRNPDLARYLGGL